MRDLTIIIPFIGAWEYTRNALSTLRTVHPFTLYLIDNKPELGTIRQFREEVEHLFDGLNNAEDCDIIYDQRSPGLFVAQSWNYGITKARENPECKYILVANNDILFHPDTIDNLINFKERTGYAMVTARNMNDGTFKESDLQEFQVPVFNEADLAPISNWREEGPDFSCFLISPDLVDKVGWFDENFKPAYFEDNDYHYRLLLSGEHAKRISTAPYFHYGSRTTQLNPEVKKSLDDTYFIKNKIYFIHKWGDNPSDCMDGKGYTHPFNNQDLGVKDWKGNKYESL